MKFSTIIKHSAELIRIILNSPNPADNLTSEYLRSKKYLGSNDRKIISEIVFSNLRINTFVIKSTENYLFEKKITNLMEDKIQLLYLLSTIIINGHFDSKYLLNLKKNLSKINIKFNELIEIISEVIIDFELSQISPIEFMKYQINSATDFLNKIYSNEPLLATELCLSETVIDSLQKKYDNKTINLLAYELMHPAPLCLRVNTLTANIDEIIAELKTNEINAVKSVLSPAGIIIEDRINLSNFDFFKNGEIEVQDIGSQLISYSLAPDEGTEILDACAGAGGKSLHLATLTNDRSNITSTDIEYKRLKEISIRARKAGLSSINSIIIKENDLQSKIQKNKFDYILIDAPCSGLGTVRRMPMAKYRLNDKLLSRITKNQYEILSYYSQFLTENGILVYSTCSLLPDENENIIGRFLSENSDFSPYPLKPAFDRYDITIPNLKDNDFSLALTPLNRETDGFFMAKIQKKSK